MPVSHYEGFPEDLLRISLVYALTPMGSPGDPQGIYSSVALYFVPGALGAILRRGEPGSFSRILKKGLAVCRGREGKLLKFSAKKG